MSTRIPKAYETIWAQEAIREELARAASEFVYNGHDRKPSGEIVFLVNAEGVCRSVDAALVQTEAWRIAQVRALGRVPEGCSDDIHASPARGPVRVFTPMKYYPSGDDEWELKPSGELGADGAPVKSIIRSDAFDVMMHRARVSHRGSEVSFVAPFTPGQIAMARDYRNLFERHASAGVRCSSVEASGGGGTGGSFIDAVLRDREMLERIHQRIGDGIALEVKRQRKRRKHVGTIMGDLPKGSIAPQRVSISIRRLVDLVCLEDLTLSEVLAKCGWAKHGGSVSTLRCALAQALDRMTGPACRRTGHTAHADGVSVGFQQFAQDAKKRS